MVSTVLRELPETSPVLGGGGSSSLRTVGRHLPITRAGTRTETAPASEPQHRVAQTPSPPWQHGTTESPALPLSPFTAFFLNRSGKSELFAKGSSCDTIKTKRYDYMLK